ncbi:hypothetical protein [Moritella viscosa]|uniref:hypothetical protein n=1 Tax=Moritella viscosa TaxID=80854 RepID=UPI0009239F8F|nr:hypothetical protein [Moritella viscosa]SGY86120.1 Putative uncharacterized protein VV0800 [Moritella viscosa]
MKPEGRFLLLRFLTASTYDPIRLNMEMLSRQHGVSKHACETVCSRLKAFDDTYRRGSRWVGLRGYYESLMSKVENENIDFSLVENKSLIDKLLTCDLKKCGYLGKPLDGKLQISNILLLVILLHYSDALGCVRGIGYSLLLRLMGGISEDRFKSQIETLKATGYLLNATGGATGRYLFGKSTGVMHLNLMKIQNPLFSFSDGKDVDISQIELVNLLFPSLAMMSIVSAVCGSAGPAHYKAISLRLPMSSSPDFLASTKNIDHLLFDSIRVNRVDVLLQLKLEELISTLISKIGLGEKNVDQLVSDICKADGIFTAKYKHECEQKGSGVLEAELNLFQKTLAQLVIGVTCTLIKILNTDFSVRINGEHTIVYPHEMAHSTKSSIQSKFYIVSKQNDDSLVITSIEYSYLQAYKQSKYPNRVNGWELKVERFT